MLEGVVPLETFPLVEWHQGELADVPSFTVLKMQICVTHPQCVKWVLTNQLEEYPAACTVICDSVMVTFVPEQPALLHWVVPIY